MVLTRLLMLTLSLAIAFPAIAADSIVVVIVRHAEKAADDPRDPTLSEAGRARATALAKALEHASLDAAYSTQYRRTRQTAEPAAKAAGLDVQVRPIDGSNAATYAADLARDLRALPAGSTALVVGHSNTVPDLVQAISGEAAAPMPETEFDRYTVVTLDADGKARVSTSRY
jgi:broad specificity phosphatase PhoE